MTPQSSTGQIVRTRGQIMPDNRTGQPGLSIDPLSGVVSEEGQTDTVSGHLGASWRGSVHFQSASPERYRAGPVTRPLSMRGRVASRLQPDTRPPTPPDTCPISVHHPLSTRGGVHDLPGFVAQ